MDDLCRVKESGKAFLNQFQKNIGCNDFDGSKTCQLLQLGFFSGQDCFGYSLINVFRFCSLKTKPA
jgi:hypothetical protein